MQGRAQDFRYVCAQISITREDYFKQEVIDLVKASYERLRLVSTKCKTKTCETYCDYMPGPPLINNQRLYALHYVIQNFFWQPSVLNAHTECDILTTGLQDGIRQLAR
jgi:hypothetical protein